MLAALDVASLTLFLVLMGAVVVWDMRAFRIPNLLVLALVAAFLAGRTPTLGLMPTLMALAVGAAVLAAGFGLYAGRVWGGGDAKLLGALALWVGLDGLGRLLIVTAVAGGVLAGGLYLARRWRGEAGTGVPMPYGVALAVGGLDWVVPRVETLLT